MSDQADPERYVFISYDRGDSEFVDSLHRKLEAAGIAVWRDSASMSPGEDWAIKVRQAIAGAAVFLACFSSRGSGRRRSYQNEEILLAVEQVRQRPLGASWLIPVRFDECALPDHDLGPGRTLSSLRAADMFGDRAAEETARLISAISEILRHQSVPGPLRGRGRTVPGVRRRRLAVLSLVVSIAAAAGATVLVIDRLPAGRPGSHAVSRPLLAASVFTSVVPCRKGSGLVVPDRGQQKIPYPQADRQPAGAVLTSGSNITVTVQGETGQAVVLQSITVTVIRRASPLTGLYLPAGCQGELTPRHYVLHLDSKRPHVVPRPDNHAFPYKVTSDEPEVFVITPVTTGDVQWRMYLKWTSEARQGELVLTDSGHPFQMTAAAAARPFCNGNSDWTAAC